MLEAAFITGVVVGCMAGGAVARQLNDAAWKKVFFTLWKSGAIVFDDTKLAALKKELLDK